MLEQCSMNECSASVAKIKIPYYRVIHARGFWRPSKKLQRLGFHDVRCGKDGPIAWEIAHRWNTRVQATLRGDELPPNADGVKRTREIAEVVRKYPPRSVGAGFQAFIETDEWKNLALSNRQKVWWPAWYRIRDMWGDCDPNSINYKMMSKWRAKLEQLHGRGVAHKTLKIWRALWNILLGMKIARGADPSTGIRNRAPKPRHEQWSDGEAVILVKAAWRSGYRGLACVIATAWDTQFSPVDVRTLAGRHMKIRGSQMIFDRSIEGRAKTGRAALGTLSRRTERLVRVYLAATFGDAELMPDTPLFRNRSNSAYREDTLSDDFADVREIAFPGDKRRLMDMRRSGTVEAVAGEAEPMTIAAKMANSIETANHLHKTYAPVELSAVRAADAARLRGRRRIRDENE
jgi:hypothetical protein